MVMAVDRQERVNRHPKKARCLPRIDAVLHGPGSRGMSQGVRCHTTLKPGGFNGPFGASVELISAQEKQMC